MAIKAIREVIAGCSPHEIRRRAARIVSGAVLVGAVLLHTSANAIPIGDFAWNEFSPDQCDIFCGAFFSVDNFSTDPDVSLGALGDSFFAVSVDLQTDAGPLTLPLGDIAPGDSSQSIDDLSALTIASATLTLTFGVPGTIQLLDDFGNIVTALTGPGVLQIDYSAPVAQVPEPGTLLLLMGGLVGIACRRRSGPTRSAARDSGRAVSM
jgi:hypothetical protein